MRPVPFVLASICFLAACVNRLNVECIENSNCDLFAGGLCTTNPSTENQWCTYPDPECPSGRRWSDLDVGDGVSGTCVVVDRDAIAFVSTRDGNAEIYLMRPDGRLQTNLTSNPADDFLPLWDPTGERIAFLSKRGGIQQLYTMNADGSNVENASRGQADSPAWAPDGSRIAFTSDRTGTPEIYSAAPDGSTVTPLTSLGMTSTGNASWAPDGSRIAFESLGRIYLINADGTNATPISAGAFRGDHHPTWKPDGSKIAFSRGLTFEDHDIFVMNPDGSNAVNVTETMSTTTLEPLASWSPDGTQLAGEISEGLAGQPTSGTGIYVVDAAGTRFDNIVLPKALRPCWSPDGASLIYDSDRNGNSELYSVPRAGGSSVNLTNSAGNDTQCAWRPRYVSMRTSIYPPWDNDGGCSTGAGRALAMAALGWLGLLSRKRRPAGASTTRASGRSGTSSRTATTAMAGSPRAARSRASGSARRRRRRR